MTNIPVDAGIDQFVFGQRIWICTQIDLGSKIPSSGFFEDGSEQIDLSGSGLHSLISPSSTRSSRRRLRQPRDDHDLREFAEQVVITPLISFSIHR